jgi:hypothetical protein
MADDRRAQLLVIAIASVVRSSPVVPALLANFVFVLHGVTVDAASCSVRRACRLILCVGLAGLPPRRIASGPHDPFPNRPGLFYDKSIGAVAADTDAEYRTGRIC